MAKSIAEEVAEIMRGFQTDTDDLSACKNVIRYPATHPDAMIEFHQRIASGGDFTPEEKTRLAQYGSEGQIGLTA
jgi:hypothetical protein